MLCLSGFELYFRWVPLFAWVIGGEVYVAWKRKMLHDVTGGYRAYIQRKIYL